MAHNYEEFPFPEFKHAIKSGKNTYRNKFFHDIDLSFLLKWMESIEGENYTIRIVGNKLQLINGEGQVVSEVTLSEGQQGPPGVTPNVSAAAFVNDSTGTPSVEVVKSGTTENPTFSFNFSNLKGATGATGPASTVPGPAGTPFQVKAQYDTYDAMIAAHPTGEVGDAYQVGENSGLATVATTGDYDDLINKPTIPAAQINADWDAVSGVAQILNKPTIPAAQVNSDWNADSGVAAILNKPTIPTVNNPTITITQGGVTKGSFTLNQSSAQTIDVDAGGGGGSIELPAFRSVSAYGLYDDPEYTPTSHIYWVKGDGTNIGDIFVAMVEYAPTNSGQLECPLYYTQSGTTHKISDAKYQSLFSNWLNIPDSSNAETIIKMLCVNTPDNICIGSTLYNDLATNMIVFNAFGTPKLGSYFDSTTFAIKFAYYIGGVVQSTNVNIANNIDLYHLGVMANADVFDA